MKNTLRPRINTLCKRMDRLDKYIKDNNNSLKCDVWQRYFNLMNDCSTEYANLIRS